MYKPFTLRAPKADEFGTYQALHSANPCVVVNNHLKKGRYDILGISANYENDGNTRCFYPTLSHRDFRRARFDVLGTTHLHDETGIYKVISIQIYKDYRMHICITAQKTEPNAMLAEAFAMHIEALQNSVHSHQTQGGETHALRKSTY